MELLRLWNKFLNRSDLTIDDDFFESGGDLLLAVELLVEIEQLTQAKIPPSILFETGTVRRLAERLGRQESLTPQPAVRIGGVEGRLFHFFHGDIGKGGLSVPKLATMLGPHRPILAIAPHGNDGERVPASIEEMAADRLPVILYRRSLAVLTCLADTAMERWWRLKRRACWLMPDSILIWWSCSTR